MDKKIQLGIIIIVIILLTIFVSPFSPLKNTESDYNVTIEQKDFTLENLDGEKITLTDYKGKIIVLDFMQVNCPACKEEISELKKAKQQFGDEIVILSIVANSKQKIIDFKQEQGANWQFLVDDDAEVITKNVEKYIPKIMIFNKEGELVFQREGKTPYQTIKQKIEKIQ